MGVCKWVLTPNESIYETLNIREDLNMSKCTVSCILYPINSNVVTHHDFNLVFVFHAHGHKLGLLSDYD